MADTATLIAAAAQELRDAAAGIDAEALDALAGEIASARRIAVHGVGREGLMMRALTMRLFHLGCAVHPVGDMTTPPIGPGDLLLVSAGPGEFATVAALVDVAMAAGARTACVTAQPQGSVPARCDRVLTIPARTMANEGDADHAILPMGSVYEGAQFIVFEILILRLAARLEVTPDAMRARHTNLE